MSLARQQICNLQTAARKIDHSLAANLIVEASPQEFEPTLFFTDCRLLFRQSSTLSQYLRLGSLSAMADWDVREATRTDMKQKFESRSARLMRNHLELGTQKLVLHGSRKTRPVPSSRRGCRRLRLLLRQISSNLGAIFHRSQYAAEY